jgi:hypothetical protein
MIGDGEVGVAAGDGLAEEFDGRETAVAEGGVGVEVSEQWMPPVGVG